MWATQSQHQDQMHAMLSDHTVHNEKLKAEQDRLYHIAQKRDQQIVNLKSEHDKETESILLHCNKQLKDAKVDG